uniref:Uncharacterized protein n=1 Tax=Anguilla anguilla TaxID=7936 RepID=A0A0E9V066_ANGAN
MLHKTLTCRCNYYEKTTHIIAGYAGHGECGGAQFHLQGQITPQ